MTMVRAKVAELTSRPLRGQSAHRNSTAWLGRTSLEPGRPNSEHLTFQNHRRSVFVGCRPEVLSWNVLHKRTQH